jgi:type VI secretion system protein ImpK
MQEDVANLVYPTLTYGLHLRARLERGEELVLETEQAKLKGMLLTETEARRLVDFGGDGGAPSGMTLQSFNLDDPVKDTPQGVGAFLGIRYALACWLDEIFVLDSPWSAAWNERKLEGALYGTNDRAWRFWEQAQKAERRPSRDSLEAFFLCVMLGFRGEYAEDPIRLDNWVSAARAHINRGLATDWPYPPEVEAPTHVPPRRGRDQLERMVVRGGVLLLLLIPFLVAFLIQQLGQ